MLYHKWGKCAIVREHANAESQYFPNTSSPLELFYQGETRWLAEEFGLPAKRTLDDVFARSGQMEGIRVEVHQQNKKYYGYFGEPGEELTMEEGASEEDPGDEQPADPLGLLMESLKQRMWQKALTQARRETGKEGEGSLNDEC